MVRESGARVGRKQQSHPKLGTHVEFAGADVSFESGSAPLETEIGSLCGSFAMTRQKVLARIPEEDQRALVHLPMWQDRPFPRSFVFQPMAFLAFSRFPKISGI